MKFTLACSMRSLDAFDTRWQRFEQVGRADGVYVKDLRASTSVSYGRAQDSFVAQIQPEMGRHGLKVHGSCDVAANF